MDKQENIEEFYQRKYGWMPDNIRKVALGWLLAKKPWIVPIPGQNKGGTLTGEPDVSWPAVYCQRIK